MDSDRVKPRHPPFAPLDGPSGGKLTTLPLDDLSLKRWNA